MTQETFQSPAFFVDLEGTLIDSVYRHGGGLLVQALSREIGQRLTQGQVREPQEQHATAYERYCEAIQPLLSARKCLRQT